MAGSALGRADGWLTAALGQPRIGDRWLREGGEHAAFTSDGVRVRGAGGQARPAWRSRWPLNWDSPWSAKDKLKETLHDALGPRLCCPIWLWSRKLGAAAMELLWALAADAPSVVIEANFRPRDPYQRRKLSALAEQPVEAHYCECDPELAARRYNERARTCHPIHVQASVPPDVRAEYD